MKTLYKANGREIQALRKKKNLTIVDLAKRAGYATRTIKRAENSDSMEITTYAILQMHLKLIWSRLQMACLPIYQKKFIHLLPGCLS